MNIPLDAGYAGLVNCTGITVENLTLTNNWQGALLASTTNSTITKNNITENHAYGIDLWESSNYNTVCGNNITNNSDGIHLTNSFNNMISGNNITNSEYGIRLWRSSNNIVSGNTVANNDYGAHLSMFTTTKFYHNSFVNNTEQVYSHFSWNVWDDGYPSGGNYWSDHVTVDECCGVNQDEPGSDGIVDEPYIINADNRDHYPLVEPWSPVIPATIDIAPDSLHSMNTGQWITCYIELPEGYNVSDIDVSTVMLNDTIPVSLLDMPAPDPVPMEIGDYDNDTIPDLMVKFDRAMVSEFILSQRMTNGVVTLTITGEVSGTAFEGTDTIRVLMGGGGAGAHAKVIA